MHSIKQFCDKIDSIKSMADKLRKTPPSDRNIQNQIEVIQSDCLLVAKEKLIKNFLQILKIMKNTIMIILVLTMLTALSINEDE